MVPAQILLETMRSEKFKNALRDDMRPADLLKLVFVGLRSLAAIHEAERINRGADVYMTTEETNEQASPMRLVVRPVPNYKPRDPQELLDLVESKRRSRVGLEEDVPPAVCDDEDDSM
jgi:hypothetical protein